MPNLSKPTKELVLNEDAADAHNAIRGAVEHDERVVVARGLLGIELLNPSVLAWVGDDSKNGQNLEVTALVI